MSEQFTIKREQGDLNVHRWSAKEPKGVIVLIHGVGEHAGRYQHVGTRLAEAGFSVYGVDLPGHGRSAGKRGHVGGSYEIVKIVDTVIIYAKKECPGVPVIVFGHSMGGNIALMYRYYRREETEVTAYVSSSPWIMVNNPTLVKHYRKLVFAAQLLPKLTISSGAGVTDGALCVNPVRGAPDALCHSKISLQTGVERERDARMLVHNAELGKPVYLFNGDADSVCLPEGAHLFRDKAGRICTYREWQGLGHECMNEACWEEVVDAVIAWIETQI